MSSIAEQITSAQHTGLEIFTNLINSTFNNAEEMARLNFQTAEAIAGRSIEHFGALAANRSLPGWLTLNRSLASSTFAASLGYSRRAAEIYGEWLLTPARILDNLATESRSQVEEQATGAAPALDFFAAATRSMASLASLNPLLSASFSRAGAGDGSEAPSRSAGGQSAGGRSTASHSASSHSSGGHSGGSGHKGESAAPTRIHAGKRTSGES